MGWAHRTQDHHRHVRWLGRARRRRVLRKGPDEGRSLGCVHLPADGEVGGEERPQQTRARAVSYAIGVAKPLSLFVETYGTEQGSLTPEAITQIVKIAFDCRPGAIAKSLQLREPKYQLTAAYGHFGRMPYTENGMKYFEWENATDL